MINKILEEDFEYILSDINIDWKIFEGKTILITGISGMLASFITKTLLYLNTKIENKIKIIGLVRNLDNARKIYEEFLDLAYFSLVKSDLTNDIQIDESIDYIIHSASQANPKLFFEDPVGTIEANTIGTNNLLKLAKAKKVKGFLYFSSGEVCGDIFNTKNIVTENDYGIINPLDVRSCYGESKKLGENLCHCYNRQYNVPTKIVRPSHTYGPGFKENDGRVFASFVMSIVNGDDIVLNSDGSAKRSFVYIADAIRAYFIILLKGANGEAYNVGNDYEISILELANILVSLPENRKSKIVINIDKNSASAKSTHGQIDISKIKELGWEPKIQEKEGFTKTINYYLSLKNHSSLIKA